MNQPSASISYKDWLELRTLLQRGRDSTDRSVLLSTIETAIEKLGENPAADTPEGKLKNYLENILYYAGLGLPGNTPSSMSDDNVRYEINQSIQKLPLPPNNSWHQGGRHRHRRRTMRRCKSRRRVRKTRSRFI